MIRLVLLSLIIHAPLMCYAQLPKTIDYKGDTTSNYSISKHDANQYGLNDLKLSGMKRHFRFWTTDHVVEIWSADGISYLGNIMDFIYSYKKKRSLILKRDTIASSDIQQIIDSYNLLKIDTISTDKKIANYIFGNDGGDLIIESTTPETYSHKEYWEPSEQTARQCVAINDFLIKLSTVLRFRKRYNDFIAGLPTGKYTIGMMIIEKTVGMNPKGGMVWRY